MASTTTEKSRYVSWWLPLPTSRCGMNKTVSPQVSPWYLESEVYEEPSTYICWVITSITGGAHHTCFSFCSEFYKRIITPNRNRNSDNLKPQTTRPKAPYKLFSHGSCLWNWPTVWSFYRSSYSLINQLTGSGLVTCYGCPRYKYLMILDRDLVWYKNNQCQLVSSSFNRLIVAEMFSSSGTSSDSKLAHDLNAKSNCNLALATIIGTK